MERDLTMKCVARVQARRDDDSARRPFLMNESPDMIASPGDASTIERDALRPPHLNCDDDANR
jgi:hypothetical protein